MSAAEMAGRVGGPTYLRGSWLGTAVAAPSDDGVGTPSSVVREADAHATSTVSAAQRTANEIALTRSPWVGTKKSGQATRAYPGLSYTNKTTSDDGGQSTAPCYGIPAGACGLSGMPGTDSIFFCRGHSSSSVLPSYSRPFFIT